MKHVDDKIEKIKAVKLPQGKFCTLHCGDCTYFSARKTSFGKCWCGYFKSYTRNSSDLACSHFVRG